MVLAFRPKVHGPNIKSSVTAIRLMPRSHERLATFRTKYSTDPRMSAYLLSVSLRANIRPQ